MTQRPVYIIEDDPGVRRLLVRLVTGAGYPAMAYQDAESFLAEYRPGQAGCVLLDLRLPGMSGLELQERLAGQDDAPPIIFISGQGDVASVRVAMKRGCVDFLEKPFSENELLELVRKAMVQQARWRRRQRERAGLERRLASLTPREREVLKLVVAGKTNKMISEQWGVSVRTVEIHRANVMKKMGANSLAELVRMFLLLQEC